MCAAMCSTIAALYANMFAYSPTASAWRTRVRSLDRSVLTANSISCRRCRAAEPQSERGSDERPFADSNAQRTVRARTQTLGLGLETHWLRRRCGDQCLGSGWRDL